MWLSQQLIIGTVAVATCIAVRFGYVTEIPDAHSGCVQLKVLLVCTEFGQQPPACATGGGCNGPSCPHGS